MPASGQRNMGWEEKKYAKKKRGLTITEVVSENGQIVAFKLKKLAIDRSHKLARKLIRPRVSVVSP